VTLQIHPPPREVIGQIRDAIESAIAGAEIEVSGSGGHFEIRVVSDAFAGKNTLARQRLVYAAIAHLMKGDGAPVHAVDRLQTVLPEQA
jgi:acid stress-induced BolA-like protein IbaG/YrbA